MGLDILCFHTEKKFDGQWDCVQCKRYACELKPSQVWVELGKIIYHSFNGEYPAPKNYYFAASMGLGLKLKKLLTKPDELKAKLIENWDGYCKTKITDMKEILLEGKLLAYLNKFDFRIFKMIPIAEMIRDHAGTVFVATNAGVANEQWQTLGAGLPRVPVTQLKILPGRKLLAATYGRNIWILDLASNSSPGKADLVPTFNCHKFTGQLSVTIKNLGHTAAPASTTALQFIPGATTSQLTLPIPAGGSADLAFDIQGKCGTGCRFSITADSGHRIDESNETNNFLEGICLQ